MISKSKTGMVKFVFDGSSEKAVYLVGDFNDWDTKATQLTYKSGKWAVQKTLKPGTYQFRYYVDGSWYNDAKADSYVPNQFGGHNSVIVIG